LKTTLYNHKAIGTDEKPLIPNVILKALLILAEHKDRDACDYILKNYTLHPQQKQMYDQTLPPPPGPHSRRKETNRPGETGEDCGEDKGDQG